MSTSLPFNAGQTWSQKVFEADHIWAQVEQALKNAGAELPKTPRRPDIRIILNNTTGKTLQFLNPGDHSGEKQEFIPGTGDQTAVMIMPGGTTLAEQYANAKLLDEKYGLSEKGLSEEFVRAMAKETQAGTLLEAYGPAPFEGQAARLAGLEWSGNTITPVIEGNIAYGARPPEKQSVFRSEIAIFIKGTSTTPEKMEMEGMCVAVTSDWQTGLVSTRPIVPSVAKDFYGDHYRNMPTVELDTEGNLASIDLKNGKPKIYLNDPAREALSFKSQRNGDQGGYDLAELS